MKLPRWLNPRTNPAGWSALLGLAYATWQAVTAAQAQGPLTWKQAGYIAAGVLWAAVSAYVRSHVTPVADPRDGNGKPLVAPLSPDDLKIARAVAAWLKSEPSPRAAVPEQPAGSCPKCGQPIFADNRHEANDRLTCPAAPAAPVADRAAESERRWIEARKRGGYTGGGAAEDMRPPPTDVPSVSRPLVPPTPPPAKEQP
jgi:hypothetical protein